MIIHNDRFYENPLGILQVVKRNHYISNGEVAVEIYSCNLGRIAYHVPNVTIPA
jgi:hypothetical protein